MRIETILVGNFTNCYLVIKNDQCLIVDPGFDSNRIIKKINDLKLKVAGILITHAHFDHIGELNTLKKYFKVDAYDFNNLEEKNYQIGIFNLEVIYTPGHTSDSITFYFKEIETMLVGDFIFLEDIGRCDLPTGDINIMKNSIQKIKQYNPYIKVYPGHEEATTLAHEIKYNPYFK